MTAMTWTPDAGFDGEPEPTPDAALRYVPTTSPRHRAPRPVVDLVHQMTGVDVADADVDRSPDTTRRATELGAIAFTDGDTVHLPAELGDLDEPRARAALAHELTHVAQHRRRRAATPAEDSEEGRRLEAEARDVQHAAATGVRPTVVRRMQHVPSRTPTPGVQRLEDDAYAWQERDDEVSPSDRPRLLGLFGGSYSFRSDSAAGRRAARADEEWDAGFEARHARRLVARREERYRELLDEALDARRRDPSSPSPARLSRGDVIAVRERVDREMPFEHGVPTGFAAFPDELPEATPEETAALDGEIDGGPIPGGAVVEVDATRPRAVPRADGAATGSSQRTPRTVPTVRRTPSSGGRPPGSSRAHPLRAGRRAADPYEWQQREPTGAETVAGLFGGGLLGDVLGRVVGADTDEDREQAERAQLPALIARRREHELELRHRLLRTRLRDRLAADEREERPPEGRLGRGAITLEDADITTIREQVDAAMPLEFAVPEYVPADQAAQISADGTISARTEPAATAAPDPAADGAPAPDTTPHDAPVPDTASSGAPAPAAARGGGSHDPAAVPPAPGQAPADPTPSATGALVGAAASVAGAARRDEGDRPDHDREQGAASSLFASASELDIDALSRRVWSRIRREMRAELLIDRERAGVLADSC